MLPDRTVFQTWLRSIDGFAEADVQAIEPVAGGASNITCRVTLARAGAVHLCLRLQRDRGIFEPYDVIRESHVLRCLADSSVPVPRLIAVEPGRVPLGAPFIVMEWVDAPHMGLAADADFGAFTRAVVGIHSLDWHALGLDFLGVPATPAAALRAELDGVAGRMDAFGCSGEGLLVEALAALRRRIPADGTLSLCQGDINIFNYLFRAGEVAAVVDWEQARISDRRSDIGQLIALSHLKGAPWGDADHQGFVLAYAGASGQAIEGMHWFRARWLFELGVIYHGWVRFNGSGPWYSWPALAALLGQALAELG